MILDKNNICEYLKKNKDYSTKNTSYSPFYSNIALELHDDKPGIDKLWLHINRYSRVLWNTFAGFDAVYDKDSSSPWITKFKNGDKKAALTFYDTDCIYFSAKNIEKISLLKDADEMLLSFWQRNIDNNIIFINGYSKNGDARDPEESMPFTIGIKIIKGNIDNDNVISSVNGLIEFAFCLKALEFTDNYIIDLLNSAPNSIETASTLCFENIQNTVKDLHFECTEDEAELIGKAINGLIGNISKAPGNLKYHLSAYPSRGYSSHFMWDTCFQNLAYERMSLDIAKDFLLQFASCQRSDGKYPQFLCSTWSRPSHAQPMLTGWATVRLFKKTSDIKFAKTMLDSIIKNNEWWLSNRMTSFGVISCPHGLETGQDDSPRFDNGGTIACDMNSYLLNQMRCTVYLANGLGEKDISAYWTKQADSFSEQIIEVLYCQEDNIFYDVDPICGKFIKIVSPVSFLPFWAGIKLENNMHNRSIEQYLINENYLFGDIPFPSVAYNSEYYQHDKWWRGPTWLPNAWLMLETLEKFGYKNEQLSAAQKLHDIVMKDRDMHELFDSENGLGLGEKEQGWTCAVFMALCELLGGNK